MKQNNKTISKRRERETKRHMKMKELSKKKYYTTMSDGKKRKMSGLDVRYSNRILGRISNKAKVLKKEDETKP